MSKTLLLLVALLATGCGVFASDEPLLIKNACKGTWALVKDGEGRQLVSRLEYNQPPVAVEVEGYRGSTIYLHATLFELGTNIELGTAETSRSIPQSSFNSGVGPSQLQPWNINAINYTTRNGGCRQ